MSTSEKKNCWNHKNCGREPGGARHSELGVCPASTVLKLEGVHGGNFAGRACWVVAGTMCGGKVQGLFARKWENCSECDFYMSVQKDEGLRFQHSMTLLRQLKD